MTETPPRQTGIFDKQRGIKPRGIKSFVQQVLSLGFSHWGLSGGFL